MMDIALDSVLTQAKARVGSLMMIDPDHQALKIVAARGFPKEIIDQIKNLALAPGQGIAGHVYQTGRPYYLRDSRADNLFINQNLPSVVHFQFLSLPIKDSLDKVIGVLNIHFPTEKLLNTQELDDLNQLANDLIRQELNSQPSLLN